MKPIVTAIGYGFVGGIVTALVLELMRGVSDFVWGWTGGQGPIVIFAVVMVGGAIIALLRHRDPNQNFDDQLREGQGDRPAPLSRTGNAAALGITSFGFGGAIGPEGGVVAVIEALSSQVSTRLSSDVQQQRLIRQAGLAGSLGGLYGSPPVGPATPTPRPRPRGGCCSWPPRSG